MRSNRTEARTMLLNNPQLAYALLQAQVSTAGVILASYIVIIHYIHA